MIDEDQTSKPPPPAPKKRASKPKAKRSAASAEPARAIPRSLAATDVEAARTAGRPWDRATRFVLWDYFVHSKFGVGHVVEVTQDGFIVCLFEDGATRKLIHGR